MPFTSTRAKLNLTDEDQQLLDRLSQSRSEPVARIVLRQDGQDAAAGHPGKLEGRVAGVDRTVPARGQRGAGDLQVEVQTGRAEQGRVGGPGVNSIMDMLFRKSQY